MHAGATARRNVCSKRLKGGSLLGGDCGAFHDVAAVGARKHRGVDVVAYDSSTAGYRARLLLGHQRLFPDRVCPLISAKLGVSSKTQAAPLPNHSLDKSQT